MCARACDEIRSGTVHRRERSFAETQWQLGRVERKRHVAAEKHPPQQDFVDAATRKREPRLGEDVVEEEGLRSVGIAAAEHLGIDELETREGRMGSKPMREDDETLRRHFSARLRYSFSPR